MVNFSDLTKVLQEQLTHWEGKATSDSVGSVVQVGDSVATVYGLDKAVYGELVEFQSGATGMVLNLLEDGVGCVLFSGESVVRDGEEVRGTGRVVTVPGGTALLGRVLNPLGAVVDGKGPVAAEAYLPIEAPAAPVIDRGSVDTPLQTGILSVDTMVPIGRGQRELIIGDRQTGKTALALDAIINQKGSGVYCVYCAI
ncbi:MAG: F0F1 ATP synthase subunit alpha, partial [Spirochaetaceae bacterium]|nr:F0F1 ATP synthase subunit alpha [Spirochaetaceae bacterium]